MEGTKDTSETLGLRERKKLETRRAIRQSALDLALEHGLENVTVEAIAEGAGVSSRTFFNYFSSKEEALVTDTAKVSDRLRPLLADRPLDESPFHSLRIVLTETDPLSLTGADRGRALARMKMVHKESSLMMHQLAQQVEFEKQMTEILAERFGADATEDARPELLAGLTGSIFRVAVRRWARGSEGTLLEILRDCFDQVENGALTQAPEPAEPPEANS